MPSEKEVNSNIATKSCLWDLRRVERVNKFRKEDIVSFSKNIPHEDHNTKYRVLNVCVDRLDKLEKTVLCRIKEANNISAKFRVVKQDDLVLRTEQEASEETRKTNALESDITTEDIRIYRDDNKTVALDINTGRKGIAYCHIDNDFDIYIGAKIALERLTSIQTGDIVEVIYNSKAYTRYIDWLEENIEDRILKYSYAIDEYPPLGEKYQVMCIARDSKKQFDKLLAYIKNLNTNRCYLMNVDDLVLEDRYNGDI